MVLRWPQEYGEDVPFPGLIFRQILAQSQAIQDPLFTFGVADIIAENCPNGSHHYLDDDQEERETGPVTPRDIPRRLRGSSHDGQALHLLTDDDDTGHARRNDDAATVDDWIEGGLHHCQDAESRCCGELAPACCFMTGHINKVMQNYSPQVIYFALDTVSGQMEAIEAPTGEGA